MNKSDALVSLSQITTAGEAEAAAEADSPIGIRPRRLGQPPTRDGDGDGGVRSDDVWWGATKADRPRRPRVAPRAHRGWLGPHPLSRGRARVGRPPANSHAANGPAPMAGLPGGPKSKCSAEAEARRSDSRHAPLHRQERGWLRVADSEPVRVASPGLTSHY